MYEIFHMSSMGTVSKRLVQIVPSLNAARTHLESTGEIIAFEIDPDGHDAADAAVLHQGMLEIYTVERVAR